MKIYRDDREWIENCQECQVPMYRVVLAKGRVLTGIPDSVKIEPDSVYAHSFRLWAQHPCVLPNTVHWCPQCRVLWAVIVGLPFWTKAGVIEEVNTDLNRMKVRMKFDLQNDIIPVPVSGNVPIQIAVDTPPFNGATMCIKCHVWREQKLQAVHDGVLVWHWCSKCGEGEPMPEIKLDPESVTVKDLFPEHVETEDILS